MMHQAEEERQVVLVHTLLVERQDVGAVGRVQQEIGVLDTFGDALIGRQRTDVIGLQKTGEIVFGDVGVNCQGLFSYLGR